MTVAEPKPPPPRRPLPPPRRKPAPPPRRPPAPIAASELAGLDKTLDKRTSAAASAPLRAALPQAPGLPPLQHAPAASPLSSPLGPPRSPLEVLASAKAGGMATASAVPDGDHLAGLSSTVAMDMDSPLAGLDDAAIASMRHQSPRPAAGAAPRPAAGMPPAEPSQPMYGLPSRGTGARATAILEAQKEHPLDDEPRTMREPNSGPGVPEPAASSPGFAPSGYSPPSPYPSSPGLSAAKPMSAGGYPGSDGSPHPGVPPPAPLQGQPHGLGQSHPPGYGLGQSQPPAHPPGYPAAQPAGGNSLAALLPDAELEHAPAAVQAAAAQISAAQRKEGGAPKPFVPSAASGGGQPRPDEPSEKHMVGLRSGSVVNERYRVEKLIGRGGMGTVYSVRHVNTDERLALKLLHPALAENESTIQRFRTEARAPVRIGSEHVVRVVDADVSKELGVPFMVMELLEGQDLHAELQRRGALPAGEVVLYLSQLARALDKAHRKGIVHRDLKPANLYVVKREDGSPLLKVLDFGIAKLTDDAAKELTMAGQVFGTPWYMAPEQAKGKLSAVAGATDLWALGLIAYKLLTGRNYWTADGMAALVAQICYEPMPPPTQSAPHLGPLFDMWFARACNRDPAQRFQTAKEMVAELAQALGVNQTGAGLTTGGNNFGDSSIQIPMMAQTGPSGQSFDPAMSHPPGMTPSGYTPSGMTPTGATTSAGAMMAGSMTEAPLYSTQPPNRKRAANTTALVVGVVAFVVAAGAAGIYFLLPDVRSPDAAVAPGPTAALRDDETPAADGAKQDGAKEDGATDDDAKTEDDAVEDAATDKASADPVASAEPPASASAVPSAAPLAATTAAAPTANNLGTVPRPRPLTTTAPPRPPKPVPTQGAPQVGNITF